MIPGAILSTGKDCSALMAPLPSMGRPTASTTLPNNSLPTGTESNFPVVRASSPSFRELTSPSKTQPTEFSSKFRAIPKTLLGNSIISLYITLDNPSTRATPSARVIMVPTLVRVASVERLSISLRISSVMELIIDK